MNHLLANKVNYLEQSNNNLAWFTEGTLSGYVNMIDGYKQISWRTDLHQDEITVLNSNIYDAMHKNGKNQSNGGLIVSCDIPANTQTVIYQHTVDPSDHLTIVDFTLQIPFKCSTYQNITKNDTINIQVYKTIYDDNDYIEFDQTIKLTQSIINPISICHCFYCDSFVKKWTIYITSTVAGKIIDLPTDSNFRPSCYFSYVNSK